MSVQSKFVCHSVTMLHQFTPPPTVTCFLCKAWISVKEGDKSRFLHHVSSDHEVHFDLELLYVLSTMKEGQREAILTNHKEDVITDAIEEILKVDETNNKDSVITIEEFKPKKVRVDLEVINTKIFKPPDREELIELDDEPESPAKETERRVKCSKCNKRMKRSRLRPHIAAAHKQKGKPKALSNEAPKEVEEAAMREISRANLKECDFCNDKLLDSERREHMKIAHKIEVDPETLFAEKADMTLPNIKETMRLYEKCEVCGAKVEAAKMDIHLRGERFVVAKVTLDSSNSRPEVPEYVSESKYINMTSYQPCLDVF